MSYIDGFVTPVRAGVSQDEYRAFAERTAAVAREHGATRIVEGWQDDVPHGQVTDLHRAVAASEGETVAFSWIEWPDKATRDTGWQAIMADPRLQPDQLPMPFDGQRMIFGGFAVILDA